MLNLGKTQNWNVTKNTKDPDVATERLLKILKKILAKCEMKIGKKYKSRNEWITKALIRSCVYKEKLGELCQCQKMNTVLKSYYEKYCKILKKLLVKAKNEHDLKSVSNMNQKES